MQPVFFQVGSVTVYWYGVLFATGFLAAMIHWNCLAHKVGLPRGFGVELCLWVILSSVIGARTAFVLANWDAFADQPRAIFSLQQGGLIYYGGLIGAIIAVPLLAGIRRIPLWRMADFAISGVPLGHAIGRIGCLMNGCCFGAPSESWWAIPLAGVRRHPVPLAEATLNLALYIVLLQLFFRKHREGRVFAAYLLLYPLLRLMMEFLRGDLRLSGLFLNAAQELSLFFFIVGIILWISLPPNRHYSRHANPQSERI